ncbi:MAG: glycosyltransferase family 2 protein [Dehalococcoidia bacterium]|nr:glycosyltransferase family 2 protein [Dehalococcoidia bacterium]
MRKSCRLVFAGWPQTSFGSIDLLPVLGYMGWCKLDMGAPVTNRLLSVIIPAYNEQGRISVTLEQVVGYLNTRSYSWEVVVVDDGSTDGTKALVAQVAGRDDRVRLVEGPHRGKGSALRLGMSQAQGEHLFFCDADLSMPINHLSRFLPPVLSDCDVAIGSRDIPGARRFGEPPSRRLQGRVFNRLGRWLLVPGFADTQCGFKCLNAAAAHRLLPLLRINGFSFDVEMLFVANRLKMRIAEVPIDWYYQGRSRVRFPWDGLRMLGELLAIRRNHLLGRYRPSPVSDGDVDGVNSAQVASQASSERNR